MLPRWQRCCSADSSGLVKEPVILLSGDWPIVYATAHQHRPSRTFTYPITCKMLHIPIPNTSALKSLSLLSTLNASF